MKRLLAPPPPLPLQDQQAQEQHAQEQQAQGQERTTHKRLRTGLASQQALNDNNNEEDDEEEDALLLAQLESVLNSLGPPPSLIKFAQ